MARIQYEVTARVHEDLAVRFSTFMTEKHIRDVLQTGAFLGASFDRLSPTVFRTSYEAASAADLDHYLAQHATRLRADVAAHFPSGIELSRETWTGIAAFEAAGE
jgi:Domain of unknown function (DUF4286)